MALNWRVSFFNTFLWQSDNFARNDDKKNSKGPFTQAIFAAIQAAIQAAIFVAIPNRSCKLAAISWRFRGDLSPQNRRDFEHARILRRFIGDFFS